MKYIYIYIMVLIDNFYRIIFYPIIFIFFPLSTNYIILCLGSSVDMISNLDPVSIIFVFSLK